MKTNTKKSLKILGLILACSTIAALIYFSTVLWFPAIFSNSFSRSNAELTSNGPWNGEASIWVSEDEKLYLYVPGTAETAGEVQGYVKTRDGDWEPCILHKQNYPGVRLTFRNGLIFEAKAKMKDGTLRLTKIEFSAEDTFPEWEKLTLQKYSVEDKIDQYPIPPQLD